MVDEKVFLFDKNGPRIVPREDAKIGVYDHGVLYGDGGFEGERVYHSRIFKHKEHMNRLYESAKAINLKIPLPKEKLSNYVIKVCRENNLRESGYIRLVVTRGEGDLGLNPLKCPIPTIFAIAQYIQMYPPKSYEDGLEILLADTHRMSARSLNPNVKSLNYLNNIMAKMEANAAGCEEAIMRDNDGFIAECTGDNFFAVFDGAVYTPTGRACLKGITRETVKQICEREGIKYDPNDIHPSTLVHATECFLTGTAAEIVPVVKIKNAYLGNGTRGELIIGDGKPGPITKAILRWYREETLKPENSTPIYE